MTPLSSGIIGLLPTFIDLSLSALLLRLLLTISVVYYISFGYYFLRNLYNSRKTGL
jgi:hypothetical protein